MSGVQAARAAGMEGESSSTNLSATYRLTLHISPQSSGFPIPSSSAHSAATTA